MLLSDSHGHKLTEPILSGLGERTSTPQFASIWCWGVGAKAQDFRVGRAAEAGGSSPEEAEDRAAAEGAQRAGGEEEVQYKVLPSSLWAAPAFHVCCTSKE